MTVVPADGVLPAGAVWIDLLLPTREEEQFVEAVTGVEVPTREEMVEIEPSSRLYVEHDAIFLTASLLSGIDKGEPMSNPVTFVLTPAHLITVRYDAPKVFDIFGAHVQRTPEACATPLAALVGLLDAIVDRLADTLEGVGDEMDKVSRSTFRRGTSKQQRLTNAALQVLLGRIAAAQDIISKARDSAVSLGRLLNFLSFAAKKDSTGSREHLKSLTRDVASLTDHATYLGGNITFLLDAALGLINIEQNAIIKIFSVAAVIFMPPTLVASVYGMNFKLMPELEWTYGYPFAIVMMIMAALLPYLFFKSRGWL
jgi:magnesium transporter